MDQGTQSPAPARVGAALERASRALLEYQHADGHFDGDVDQGTAPTAQVAILEHYLGVLDAHDASEMSRWLTGRMQPDGGFLAYPGASFSTLTETCCAYGAMAVAGVPEGDPRCRSMRAWIDARGGFAAADPITKCYLAMAGVIPVRALPMARIEQILMPGLERHVFRTFALYYGLILMFILPGLLFGLRRGGGRPEGRVTVAASRRLIDYLLEHQNEEGNWAGSQWVSALSLACLRALGLPVEHDAMFRGLASLRRLRRAGGDGLRVISLNGSVWNTAMALRVLRAAGIEGADGWDRRAVDYLLRAQSCVATPSQWTNARPGAPRSGGWAFEEGNPLGADCDTTSMVLIALADHTGVEAVPGAIQRGLQWLRSMAHEEGGFAAFGRPRRVAPPGPLFREMPAPPKGALALARFFVEPAFEFADIPTADLTGRVCCALARVDGARNRAALDGAVRFLRSQQDGDRWWGRWTTNYLAATAFVLNGLAAAGDDLAGAHVRRALAWTVSHQNADGGFGESNETYQRPEFAGTGPSNAYLTAIVLQALCATGGARGEAAARAAGYLCDTQRPDGLWDEHQAVQSMAPPELFYKNFVNFQTAPIEALAIYRARLASTSPASAL